MRIVKEQPAHGPPAASERWLGVLTVRGLTAERREGSLIFGVRQHVTQLVVLAAPQSAVSLKVQERLTPATTPVRYDL